MQFRGHSSGASLCSGTVGLSPCPILSALIRPRDLFRLLAIGMCHFLPVHHLGIAFLGRVEGQNITCVCVCVCVYVCVCVCVCVCELKVIKISLSYYCYIAISFSRDIK